MTGDKCPLRSHSYKGAAYDQGTYEDLDCLKAECAWWTAEYNQCDPTGLIPWFIELNRHLADLTKDDD